MCVEIEAKLKVQSLEPIETKLKELGGEFLGEWEQTDFYFDDADSDLLKSDRCLRLRLQVTGSQEMIFLTYKGAKEKSRFKKRKEIEIEVKDSDSVEKLLSELGYEKAIVIEKKRRIWRFGGCEVALDQLQELGSFVEIEGPDEEKVAEVQLSLGLADLPHIGSGYAVLTREKLRQTAKD